MKASDLFVRCLEAEGVHTIYGVPGEENADMMMSLEDSPIEVVITRHEQGAAFMAEAFGRLTGEAGVCLGTLGPGATNLITGVADANMDRAPMVVLTGQGDSKRLHKESHQAMDVVSMFKPVVKWGGSVFHPSNIPELVRKAFKLATAEKPGACHLELAEDLAKIDVQGAPLPVGRQRRPVADDKVMDQVCDLLRAAKRPVVLAGNGAIRRRASKQLRLLGEKTGIGVINTFMAKGAVDCAAPYSLFTIGLGAKDLVACAIDAADLVISLGYDMVEYHPKLWNPGRDKRIVHMDFLPAEIDEHYCCDVEVVGDLAHSLWMLNERLDGVKLEWELGQQAAVRREMLVDFASQKDDATVGPMRPQKVLWDVRQAMAPGDILLSDVGAHKMWIARYYQCHEPNSCLIPNGFCSMGFALPGAIAAARTFPEKKVMAICGDGGFMMNVQEMETARRLGVNMVCMVWDDGGYGLIKWKQQNQYGKHTHLDFGNPDWLKLADAFGWHGHYVDHSVDLQGALRAALDEAGPSLVVVPIDYRENDKLTQRLGDIVCPI